MANIKADEITKILREQIENYQQTLAVDQDNGGWNINYMSFAGSGGTSSPLTASRIPRSD